MAKGINYRQLMHKAFRQVMAEVLAQVARDGLPGQHHFFITFDTTHPGVDMPGHLRARYPLVSRVLNYLGILAVVMVVSMIAALALSSRLNAQITRPIVEVSEVARDVIERRDFSLRARKTTDDEIGYLVDAFNEMLAELGLRAETLEASNRNLPGEPAATGSATGSKRTQ